MSFVVMDPDPFKRVEYALEDIRAGRMVILVDDEDRENEGDLIFAAEKATPELVAFMVRYTSGYLCVPLDGEICDRLGLLPMYAVNQDKHGTAYTVNTYLKSLPHARCVAQERPAPLPWADLVRAHVSSAPKVGISKFEKFSHLSEFLHFRNSA